MAFQQLQLSTANDAYAVSERGISPRAGEK